MSPKITKIILGSFALSISVLVSGCVVNTDPEISFRPPEYVEEIPAREEDQNFNNAGSLFGQGDAPLFADRRAMKVNDIVTIIINQTAQATSTANKNTTSNSSGSLTGPSFTFGGPSQTVANLTNKLNNFTSFGLDFGNNTSTFTGTGTQNRQETFTTTIAARVIKVMQNGNYFIEGSREVLINGEKQIIRLSGVVRPTDIARDNTINSQYIADAKIMYDTQGELKRTTEKGWGTKLVQSLWPF